MGEKESSTDAIIADLTSGDDHRAEAAIKQLTCDSKEAIPALLKLLDSENDDYRWWATWGLVQICDERVPQYLRQQLHDPSLAVRQCAALGLRQRPDKAAIDDLIAALKEEDNTLSHLAAAALAAIGEDAVPALLQTLDEGPHTVRLRALRALAAIGDPRSVPALFEALQKDSALMEYWASEGLEKMGIGMMFFKP